ncbi:amidohydrolase [Brevundimonas sp. 2R-24]|uniref:Amidohydrolase n=1 Tax=Peiella sedimenti TaxID=3061083 RepID=A0ABT8SKY2_9CAUL|nr:amidohydrolase [Caulobacteraceae bacterium XZ-24]
MTFRVLLGLGGFAAAVLLSAPTALARPGDLIIFGGPIHTAEDARPQAEAVAVREGRIAYVGDLEAARAALDADAAEIDLRGAALFPGFTDAHAHLNGIGERELTLNLEGSASIAEAMARLSAWAEANPTGPIVGRGWIETHWPEARFLTRQDLDAAAPGRVVLLGRADGHATAVSSAALEAAGITRETQAPSGGEILKDAGGEPTGLLVDAAEQLVASLMPRPTPERLERIYQEGFSVYARYGWTGLHYMSAPMADVPLMERMAEEGRAPLRVYNAVDMSGAGPLFESGPREAADGRIITRAIKVYADGALGSRGAALFEAYHDRPDTRGLMQTSEAQILPVYERALRRGIQVATHAIGDRGNAEVLGWYMDAMSAVPPSERAVREPRWRIEHAQIVRPGDYAMFAGMNVIASMQPSHAIGDLHFAPARLGDQRLDGAYAWRSLIESGVTVVGGSDAPVERGDPLIEFYAAVWRHDLNGHQGPDWRPQEAVSRSDALKMFTLWPAYASFREDELGSITAGKRADFTVFDVDLMTAAPEDIPQGRALLTVVDGQVVYRAEGW